jgi:CBS domain-containing protein
MSATVQDLMTRDLVTVSPETTLRDVAGRLSAEHIGGVPVVTAGRRLVGVVSATDLVDFVAASSPPERDRTGAPDEPPTYDPDAAALDYFTAIYPSPHPGSPLFLDEEDGAVLDVFEGHVAEEVMTRRLLTVGPEAPVAEVARLMLEENVHRLLVVRDGELAGVITTRDLIRLVAAPAMTAKPPA